jgi:hypothetical protein
MICGSNIPNGSKPIGESPGVILTRRAYAELNVDMMLTKPFDVQELREVIDRRSSTI